MNNNLLMRDPMKTYYNRDIKLFIHLTARIRAYRIMIIV